MRRERGCTALHCTAHAHAAAGLGHICICMYTYMCIVHVRRYSARWASRTCSTCIRMSMRDPLSRCALQIAPSTFQNHADPHAFKPRPFGVASQQLRASGDSQENEGPDGHRRRYVGQGNSPDLMRHPDRHTSLLSDLLVYPGVALGCC